MKKIVLTKGKYAFVDDEDYEIISKTKWYAGSRKGQDKYYAMNWKGRMHRFILKAKKNQEVDHINGNTLDNRKENLRICDSSQNKANSVISSRNTSGYKGVYRSKTNKHKKWIANIKAYGVVYRLGYFHKKEDAAKAYNKKAIELFGEFARLNEI